ncbi:MAG TPA: lytic transglycosylase domain-containing protein [Bryobacteraceae bacterium]|nr:lytic transglycosylase domain-containing protein [Bryobacteraceae bacterium]
MRWFLVLLASSALAQSPREAMQASIEKQKASVAAQREAAKKQAELAGPGPLQMPPIEEAEPEPPCDPAPVAQVDPLIEGSAKTEKVDPALVRAVIRQESRFYPCAVSVHGAKGLMQLMPDTISQLGVKDPFDSKQNIEAGVKYLKQMIDRYKGDLAKALGAYNAGPSIVDEAKGVPDIPETRNYVDAILESLSKKP